ncbi:MAG: hypothetical protein ACRD0Y_05830 [Terriglobales bacterium]
MKHSLVGAGPSAATPRVPLGLALALGLVLALPLAAQNIPTVGDTTAPAPVAPGHALIHGPHETVDPANGQVTLIFSIPLPGEPGGTQPHFAIAYSSAGAVFASGRPTGGAFLYTQSSPLSSQGWSYTAPVLTFDVEQASPSDLATCQFSTEYVLQTAGEQRQSFFLSGVADVAGSEQQNDTCPQHYPQDTTDAEADGWRGSIFGESEWYRWSGAQARAKIASV